MILIDGKVKFLTSEEYILKPRVHRMKTCAEVPTLWTLFTYGSKRADEDQGQGAFGKKI